MCESTNDNQDPAFHETDAQHELENSRRRAEESRALIGRLTTRLRARDRRIQLLELAIARSAVMHHVWS